MPGEEGGASEEDAVDDQNNMGEKGAGEALPFARNGQGHHAR